MGVVGPLQARTLEQYVERIGLCHVQLTAV